MNKLNYFDHTSAEVAEIKQIRQQLADFSATDGTLEVIFIMPEGKRISVPVMNKVKIRMISKEIRNYLAEEQLMKQCRDD